MANNSEQLFGDYHPNPAPDAVVTPLQGLQSLATTVRYAAGCDGNPSSTQCESYSSDTVKNAVTNTQLNIVTLGTGKALFTQQTFNQLSTNLSWIEVAQESLRPNRHKCNSAIRTVPTISLVPIKFRFSNDLKM